MNQQIYEEAAEWLVELQDRPDATTRQRFDLWLSRSPEHVRAYLECTAISETARSASRAAPEEIEALIEGARRSAAANVIPLPQGHSADEMISPRPDDTAEKSWLARSPRPVRFAGAALVLAVIGAAVGYLTLRDIYTTAVGEQRSILLSDGSTIDMNGRSKVRVSLDTGTRAIDLMEGEVLFRVAKDRARPFVVSVSDTRVRAVGTEFAVNRRQRDLIVTVVEGTVAVSPPITSSHLAAGPTRGGARAIPGEAGSAQASLSRGGDEILVNAGEQLALSLAVGGSALPQPRQVNVNDAIAWTRRRLIFDSTPLEDVVAEFNRNSNRDLVIQPGGLKDFHVSGAFSSTDVEPFLRFLRAQPGVEVIEEQDRILISHR